MSSIQEHHDDRALWEPFGDVRQWFCAVCGNVAETSTSVARLKCYDHGSTPVEMIEVDPGAIAAASSKLAPDPSDYTIPTSPGMEVRIRNQHSHTLKDGHRLSETTVEISFNTWNYRPSEVAEALKTFQDVGWETGVAEAVKRNQEGRNEDE